MAADPVRVALLEADHVDPALRWVAGDYAEMFVRRFARHAPEVCFERFDVVGGQPLPATGRHDAVLITGSRHGVGDGLPFVDALTDLVRRAVEADLPLVGVCFGHQLIAHALGGEVARWPQGWGVGVHDTTVHHTPWWMDPPVSRFRLLMSHQDQVVTPPPGATVLASTSHASVAAVQVGSAVGFQGHPEFEPRYLDALMATRVERIGAGRIAEARATLADPTDHVVVTRWLAQALRGARAVAA